MSWKTRAAPNGIAAAETMRRLTVGTPPGVASLSATPSDAGVWAADVQRASVTAAINVGQSFQPPAGPVQCSDGGHHVLGIVLVKKKRGMSMVFW